jgi:ABC-type Fe3+-hydroxamate transport system substrate-binding protein
VITICDQTGKQLQFHQSPTRIVSLVPSLTETICYLEWSDKLLGVTKFCIHPNNIRSSSTVIGGTKNPRINDIISLNPDVVFANKEENREEDIEKLRKTGINVYVTDIKNIMDTIQWLDDISLLIGNSSRAISLKNDLLKIDHYRYSKPPISTVYLIWKDPYMSIGYDTFIHHMMDKYGFGNLLSKQTRYPILNEMALVALNPTYVFLSSEPYPFTSKHIDEIKNILPSAQVILVDGELFSWYGSRILKANQYLRNLVIKNQ